MATKSCSGWIVRFLPTCLRTFIQIDFFKHFFYITKYISILCMYAIVDRSACSPRSSLGPRQSPHAMIDPPPARSMNLTLTRTMSATHCLLCLRHVFIHTLHIYDEKKCRYHCESIMNEPMYMGLENGDECWCTGKYGCRGHNLCWTDAAASECDMGCKGDPSENCGTSNVLLTLQHSLNTRQMMSGHAPSPIKLRSSDILSSFGLETSPRNGWWFVTHNDHGLAFFVTNDTAARFNCLYFVFIEWGASILIGVNSLCLAPLNAAKGCTARSKTGRNNLPLLAPQTCHQGFF